MQKVFEKHNLFMYVPVMMVMGTLAIFTSSISALKLVSVGSGLPSAAISIGGASSSSSILYQGFSSTAAVG